MKLDKTQLEIVKSSSKNIIVSAGAGSGKTRVLTERIKYLLDSGVRADNIVAITFTNRAADEMKQRLKDIPAIGDAFIGTIHSFANKILKNSGKKYEILTLEKEIEIMKSLIVNYAKYINTDIYLQYIEDVKNVELGIESEEVLDKYSIPMKDELNILYGKSPCDINEYPYTIPDICKDRNILSFDKLIRECTKYYSSIGAKLEYLMVDELQDIGYLEYNFLISLNAENNFFVGDDWQSIYAFKGGDVRIFLRLMEDSNWTTYYLKNNYRNSRNILNIAQTVIKQADSISEKEVYGIKEEEGSVEISSRYNLPHYLSLLKESKDYKDWFILVRSNRDIFELSRKLSDMEIPFITFKQGNTSSEELSYKLSLDLVKLLTVHAAKGLESKNVLIYGNFPIYQKSYLKNSDERKVLYVACTRAEDKLVILN